MNAAGRLGIYLNDHLAGVTGALALARRAAGSHHGTPAGTTLASFAAEAAHDRDTLVAIMASLGMRRTLYKEQAAIVAERLGRWKPNGSVVRRSPMSDVVELDGMVIGTTAKRLCWQTLRALTDGYPLLDSARLDGLIARADAQLAMLDGLRGDAVATAFG